ncbi:MAG: nucleotidyltransferase domain-containing protein [Candidatus Margulisbacteria bacterium]|nr:nucleotidyltransferase domain-containing protein [Candidatus Margulisiibacteriota bacterium]MBU1021866.1 nucleotidyltransferase domain-containing protein [Candidatus Margulisiibacteriota bacterium]MBU1729025.1 nucleotidyltransferase domain-containing protein [Candidatus Margulisiibacteriota bacterium]MBU1954422.1 nucleotidyltransferase domain-containing protein [Candidatus Margulisiibacteriota bacterium]
MEKKKYKLFLEVLGRFYEAGLLKNIILIGSWCLYFYENYFKGLNFTPTIRTRDIDFLVPIPPKLRQRVDIPELLKDLGFVLSFIGSKGYMRLDHPELIVEFLVPEKGKGTGKPFPLPEIGLNAQPLRYLDFLASNVIKIKVDNIVAKVPHPAAFALHKLIIHQRRAKPEKANKDLEQALMILSFLIKNDEQPVIRNTFNSMPKQWQKNVLDSLKKAKAEEIIQILEK